MRYEYLPTKSGIHAYVMAHEDAESFLQLWIAMRPLGYWIALLRRNGAWK